MNRYWIAAPLFAALWGCGGGEGYTPKKVEAPEPPKLAAGQEASLFPLAEGNQWTYLLDVVDRTRNGNRASRAEITWRVAKVAKNGGATVGTVEVLQNGKLQDRQVWRVDAKGIYQVSVGLRSVPFSPAQPVLLFPPEDGKKFSWTGTGITNSGNPGRASSESTVRGGQIVDTEMGSLGAIAVESVNRFQVAVNGPNNRTIQAPAEMRGTTWFSPGVGLVRATQNTVIANQAGRQITLRLKSHSLKP